MKRIKLLVGLMLLSSIGFLTSCSKDSTGDITPTAGDIYTYTAVLLGGQENPTNGSFYSTKDKVFNEANANLNQTQVDMVYYFGTTNLASIVAPASTQLAAVPEFSYIVTASVAKHWTVTNQTKFKAVTIADWTLVTNDALIVANAVSLTDMNVNKLAVGNIIAFETASTSSNPSKKGLFKVISVTGTTATNRAITLEVKIQK